MAISVEWVVIIGSILGTAAATLYPYWSKLRENPELIFEKKFLGTAVVSFVSAMAIGLGLYPQLLTNVVDATSMSLAAIFAVTALSAFGLNRGSNMALTAAVPEPAATTTTTTKEGQPPSS